MPANSDLVRLIAFYLPQFHITPENNEWWGRGFTEWAYVTRTRPLFAGHYQPQLSSELGYYDLRVPEARQAQADLAREYGLHGFCYYHYWFKGRRLLERPFQEVLTSGQPKLPFCLCWANESWSRTWNKNPSEILIQQEYSAEDDREHMRWLAKALGDERYIRYKGKPLLLVYRAGRMPNAAQTADIWRDEARKQGVGDIYLCRVESSDNEKCDPADLGFDAAVEFQPDWMNLGMPLRRDSFWKFMAKFSKSARAYQQNRIFEYAVIVNRMLNKPSVSYKLFPCVTPSWDNSPRRKTDAVILKNSTPDLYRQWLATVIKRQQQSASEKLVFINGWNEWAEGNHLEPCDKWGRAYLEATQSALRDADASGSLLSSVPTNASLELSL